MKIQFQNNINDITDVNTFLLWLSNKLNKNNVFITSANIYLSLNNAENQPVDMCDKDNNKIKFVIRDKPYKKKSYADNEIFIICDDNKNPKLYVYELPDNS